jgi:hypothetical protein
MQVASPLRPFGEAQVLRVPNLCHPFNQLTKIINTMKQMKQISASLPLAGLPDGCEQRDA